MKNISTLFIIQLAVLTSMAQAWTDLTDVPAKLTFPVCVVLNGNIHLIGGGAVGGATDLHLRYTVATDTWDTLAPVPYLAQQPGGAATSGKIYYFGGGFPNSGTPLNAHFVYDPLTDSWDTAAGLPANRVIHEAMAIKDSIYVMGGQPDKLRFELYNTSADSWSSLNNLPDQHFWYGAFANLNDTIYRFGGGGFLSAQQTAQRYNVQSDAWVNLPQLPEDLHAPAAAAIGDSIYIVGGYNSFGESDRVWIYDVKAQTYQAGFNLPEVRNYHSLVSVGNCIYAIGGHDATVDKSIIRHCRGDSIDYTSVNQGSEVVSLGLYPNPVSSELNIRGLDAGKSYPYQIHDFQGRLVQAGQTGGSVDVSMLPTGLYLLHLSEGDVRRIGRFVKD
ncbi:MAG: T9SS type A sorting domain-containing protein [Vicingaceae bacterium]